VSIIKTIIDIFLHLDKNLANVISTFGIYTYVFLFLIIFCETGLVVTPFLPGDSLLFAGGTFAAIGSLDIWILYIIVLIAAILGDTVNYWIGHKFGPKVFTKNYRFLKKEHLEKTHKFYEKHGGKTIILARYIPIIRTFAPFVAGVGNMSYGKFISYNIIGGISWVSLFIFGGYFFGNIPIVRKNFEFVIIAIVFVSVLPAAIEYIKHKRSKTNHTISNLEG
jgi:membrane-associated protein